MNKIVFYGAAFIILVVGYFGFFTNPPCGPIDKQYLACWLKLGHGWDIVGFILFSIGALMYGGLLQMLGFEKKMTGGENTIGIWPWVFPATAIAGLVIMYLL